MPQGCPGLSTPSRVKPGGVSRSRSLAYNLGVNPYAMQLLHFDRSGKSVVGMNFWYVCRTEGPHVEVLEVAYKAAPAMAPRPANFFANPNILLKVCMYMRMQMDAGVKRCMR